MIQLNLTHYNTDLLLNITNEKRVYETDAMSTITNICKKAYHNKSFTILLANSGYGVSTSLNFLRKQMPNEMQICDLKLSTIKEELLNTFKRYGFNLYQIRSDSLKIKDIITSLNYIYKVNKKNVKSRLLIIKTKKSLSINDARTIMSLKDRIVDTDHAGLLLILPITTEKILRSKAMKYNELHSFFQCADDIFKLDPPSKQDLRIICEDRGIKSSEITEVLVSNSSNYRILESRINKIRAQVKAQVSME
jgi:hypothetical protein